MLDLNRKHRHSRPHPFRIEFKLLAHAALAQAPLLVPTWLPDGKPAGHEWVARNPLRRDQHLGSFSVNLRTGRWADFAIAGVSGGDLISLKAYLLGVGQTEAARSLAKEIGL